MSRTRPPRRRGFTLVELLVSAALIIGFGTFALRARRRPVVSGREELIGAMGEVSAVEADRLWVHLHGEIWQARLAASGVGPAPAPRTPVRVAAIDGLTLVVQPLVGAPQAPANQGS